MVPKELVVAPRMLLYICTIWNNIRKVREDGLKTRTLFWDEVWELMRQTYNLKYPTTEITKDGLKKTKLELAEFVLANENEGMSFDQFYERFGEEKGLDLFYFGVYSIDVMETPPWEMADGDGDDEDKVAVVPSYCLSIQD